MAKKILITGASGLIGTRLTELLLQQGHDVVHVGRSQRPGRIPSYAWDVEQGTMDRRAMGSVDAIIHLAGAGIADKRWTTARKKEIIDSRVQSTGLLHDVLKEGNHQVKSFVSASAIGYYGSGDSHSVFTEASPAGADFLARVTKQWEEASDKISLLGIRVVKLRTGIVLSEKGGVLKSMATPIKLGLGAALGDGKQYLSWIHLDDLCGIFIKAVKDESMQGAYNAVATQPVTNLEMTRAIAKTLNRPLWLPAVPGFVLKLLLGEMAELVTTGSKVSSEKIRKAGFAFQFTELKRALSDLFSRPHP
jgi:uncharacterized protein (TIGR01777 family)